MRRKTASILVVAISASLIGLATLAYFSDTETSSGNRFTAGTMNLEVKDEYAGTGWQDGAINSVVVQEQLAPGDLCFQRPPYPMTSRRYVVRNNGTVDGYPSISFRVTDNLENGQTEPEAEVDTTVDVGELSEYVEVFLYYVDARTNNPFQRYWLWGDQRYTLDELEGQVIFAGPPAPAGFSQPSYDWGAGYWQVFYWISEDAGNEIQSDSVVFDVVFGLDQNLPDGFQPVAPEPFMP